MGRDYAAVIRKLLAKAESTTFDAERDAFVAQAQELMTKYAIDAALLEAAGSTNDQIVTEEFARFHGTYRDDLMMLGHYVLRVNGCRAVYTDARFLKPQATILFATGYRSDLDRAKLLTTSLELQCATAMAAWLKDPATKTEIQRNMAWWRTGIQRTRRRMTRQFISSYTHEVNRRLIAARDRARKAARTEHGEQVGIVLVSREDRVEQAYKAAHPFLGKGRSRSMAYGGEHAASSGRAAGARADTGSPRVGGSNPALSA